MRANDQHQEYRVYKDVMKDRQESSNLENFLSFSNNRDRPAVSYEPEIKY